MKKIMIWVLMALSAKLALGQRLEDMTNIPATPQTASLFKAVATPVSYYTGQPNVSIPIYTISQDGVTMPISISFNTSGIFVTEEATNIGLGVSLNWGGSIIRSANGRPDEKGFFTENYRINILNQDLPKDYTNNTGGTAALCFPYCSNNSSLQTVTDRAYEYHAINSYNDPYSTGTNGISTDLRPDDFHYNFLDESGLFKFNQFDRKFVTFPLDDIKIDKVGTDRIDKFEITKSDGVKIIFGDGAVESSKKFDLDVYSNFNQRVDQTWFIKQITTIKNTTIDFSYTDNVFTNSTEGSDEIKVPSINGVANYHTLGNDFNTFEKLIHFINFEEGKLEFVYVYDRIDINPTDINSGLPTAGQPAPRLSQIILYDINNKKLKTFEFHQSYFTATSTTTNTINDNRLKLDELDIIDAASNKLEKYQFEYYTSPSIPSKKSLARDHWNYYNGSDNNEALIPSSLMPLAITGNNGGDLVSGASWSGYDDWDHFYNAKVKSNRFINSSVDNVFTIKKIKFPTGGEREFTYQNNEVRWYELFSTMKDISNDGFDVSSQRFMVSGQTLLDCYPTAAVVNSNNTERTTYSIEFTIQDFNDVVLGEPSLFIRTSFINPTITISQLNSWAYKIEIGLQKKNGSVYNNYATLATFDRTNYTGNILSTKLPVLPDGDYRIFVKMTTPPDYVMDNWHDANGNPVTYYHNTVIGLAYRKKNFNNIKVGGLRIKEMIDRESSNEYKTMYDYVDAGNICSGHLVSLPQYVEYISTSYPGSGGTNLPYNGYRICSQAVAPIMKTQGGNVGYTNVIQRQIGNTEEIKEEFSFSFKPSLQTGYLKEYYKETEPKIWQSGKLLSNKKFKNDVVISEDIYDYYGLENETDKGFVEEINTSLITPASSSQLFPEDLTAINIDKRHDNPIMIGSSIRIVPLYYFDNTNFFFESSLSGNINLSPPIKIPYFKTYSGFDKLKSKTTNYYSSTQVLTQTENYFYDNLPSNLGLSRQETTNSLGQTVASKFYYPQDLSSEPFMPEMISANRIGSPVKTEKFKNNIKQFEEKFIYKNDASTGNLLMPKYVYSSNFPNNNPSITDPPVGQLEIKVTYDLFDANGNLLQYHDENGLFTTLVWGYNKLYPVAKIVGSDYSTAISFIVPAVLNSSTTTDEQVRTEINKIRVGLASTKAQITTYTYVPLIGISSQTDANNKTTYYQYDDFNRLNLIKDQDGNILKTYEYKYNNNQ